MNDAHLEVAKKIGIRPLADREAAEDMKEKLTHITDNEFYAVDSLTHSIPYLVPRASALLDTIGSNFLDSLAAKGLNPNQVIITSVLRTENDVKRLRRRNGNASANSAHCFGATFDVSWKRFKKVEDKDGRPMQDVSADTLKLVLSEVLRANESPFNPPYNRYPDPLQNDLKEKLAKQRGVMPENIFLGFLRIL